jgi:hypothetical protein
MVSEFEKNREMIYRLLKLLGRMEILKSDNSVTVWEWSDKLNKPIRIK